MGTGIVAIALAMDGQATLSRGLLAVAAVIWLVFGAFLGYRLIRGRGRAVADPRSPRALTGIAATAVLGAGALTLGWRSLAWLLLVMAFAAWPPLTRLVVSRLARHASGQWFMLTVAAQGLAALAAELAGRAQVEWLALAAPVLAGCGIVAYPFVLVRFAPHDLASGRGAQWVGGGSLAICSLAFSQIALADRRLGTMAGAAEAFADVAFVLWIVAMLWLAPLLIAELRWPRLRYHPERWSTVFPLGMYAACSFSVAAAARTQLPAEFARRWIWIALAGWALAFAGMLRHAARRRGATTRRLASD